MVYGKIKYAYYPYASTDPFAGQSQRRGEQRTVDAAGHVVPDRRDHFRLISFERRAV